MKWPEDYSYGERNQTPMSPRLPFLSETSVARLQVVLDPALVLEDLQARYIDLLRTKEETGIDFLDISVDHGRPTRLDTWHLTPPHPDGGAYAVELVTAESRSSRRVRPNLEAFAKQYSEERDTDDRTAFQAVASFEVAFAAGAHVYVTENKPIFGWRRDGTMFPCPPIDALAIIGLYQRLRGPVYLLDGWPTVTASATVAELAVTALVPELTQVFQRSGVGGTAWVQSRSMLSSVRVRLERVLQDRDHLIAHHLVSGRRLPYSSAEALVERIALNLFGAFDSLARAVNLALDLDVDQRHCSFKRKDFRGKLPAGGLRNAADERHFQALLELLALLRNTIHHEALGAGSSTDTRRGSSLAPLAILPSADADAFIAESNRLGRTQRWVLDLPSSTVNDIGLPVRALPVTEDLLQLALEHIREILLLTPWPGTYAPIVTNPSARSPVGWSPNPEMLTQALWLYGMS